MDGSHPRYLNQGILKLVMEYGLNLLALGLCIQKDQIIMKPRFYHVDKDGRTEEKSIYITKRQ